jgi:hypothetical protein
MNSGDPSWNTQNFALDITMGTHVAVNMCGSKTKQRVFNFTQRLQ